MWKKEHQERQSEAWPQDEAIPEWHDGCRVGRDPGTAAARGFVRTSAEVRLARSGLRYLVRAGCGWRMLPKDFPPWQTVYWWFRRLMRRFLFRTLHDVVLMLDRERAGRQVCPSASVIDSQ